VKGHFDTPIPHRCGLPNTFELRRIHAGQGTIWNCVCGARWRLVINVGRASWFNLDNEDKRWIGEW
jgi:hypothetical protein